MSAWWLYRGRCEEERGPEPRRFVLAAYRIKYKRPAHIWRVFDPDLSHQSEVLSFIESGGIAFVCAEPWNWTDYSGVHAASDTKVAQWATFYASLKPAQLLFSPRHEPDGPSKPRLGLC